MIDNYVCYFPLFTEYVHSVLLYSQISLAPRQNSVDTKLLCKRSYTQAYPGIELGTKTALTPPGEELLRL